MCLNTIAGFHLQDMARSRPIDTTGQKGFKVLVLDEVDRISKEAQHSLRRTMEKYSVACRLVLCCNNVSKVWMSRYVSEQCVCAVFGAWSCSNAAYT